MLLLEPYQRRLDKYYAIGGYKSPLEMVDSPEGRWAVVVSVAGPQVRTSMVTSNVSVVARVQNCK
jgi:hypothetical protein